MTFIETEEFKDYQKDPEKFYLEVCGGWEEFDSQNELETWRNQE